MFVYLHLTAFRHVLFIVYLFKVYIKGSETYKYIYIYMYWVKTTKISPKAFFFCFGGGGGVVRDRFWVVFVSSKPPKKKKKKKKEARFDPFSTLNTYSN